MNPTSSVPTERVIKYLEAHTELANSLYGPCIERVKLLEAPDPHKWEYEGKWKYMDTPEGKVCWSVWITEKNLGK
jgi:hypothetical protein